MVRSPLVRPVLDAGLPLERLPGDAEKPHLVDAPVVEDAKCRARPVEGAPAPGFAAFLDGTQESRTVAWSGIFPIVAGQVAAVIRQRVDRRLVTWQRPTLEQRLYLPLAYIPRAIWAECFDAALLVDTTLPDDRGRPPEPHPTLLLERARHAVERDRERAEIALALEWCAAEGQPILIDGGLGASEALAGAACAVGVVKSHRTLFARDEALAVVLSLRQGERSSVFRIAPRGRADVLSWYLRLRSATSHEVTWGLVRVEVAGAADPTGRADEVSRWLLAELAPSAMPDSRWDRMSYGIRSCEEFLRAVS